MPKCENSIFSFSRRAKLECFFSWELCKREECSSLSRCKWVSSFQPCGFDLFFLLLISTVGDLPVRAIQNEFVGFFLAFHNHISPQENRFLTHDETFFKLRSEIISSSISFRVDKTFASYKKNRWMRHVQASLKFSLAIFLLEFSKIIRFFRLLEGLYR